MKKTTILLFLLSFLFSCKTLKKTNKITFQAGCDNLQQTLEHYQSYKYKFVKMVKDKNGTFTVTMTE